MSYVYTTPGQHSLLIDALVKSIEIVAIGGGGGGGGRTALAVALKIRSVPLFHVYRGRELVASFATRDR